MNDVLLMVLLITGFFTVLLVIGWIQEGRKIKRKKAAERARRLKWSNARVAQEQVNKRAKWAAAAAAHGGVS